jgi:glutamine---fructose-6-phosphate transaminase (isomerizing)
MCGIVGAVGSKNVVALLIEGLEKLEYRGYDSCGIALHSNGRLTRSRSTSRVSELKDQTRDLGSSSATGIAHTRWATHGPPTVRNAHPHFSFGPTVSGEMSTARTAVVHNGIIENHEALRKILQTKGYKFETETDTEVIAHLIDSLFEGDLRLATACAVAQLKGAYAIAVMHQMVPEKIIGARWGSPLVIGLGGTETYLASDSMALASRTQRFIYLEDGDLVELSANGISIFDVQQQSIERSVANISATDERVQLGNFKHFMQKEIFEQPKAVADTLEGVQSITADLFGREAQKLFSGANRILILACGTSSYAGMTAKYWLESIARIPTEVEIASEYRYRSSVANPDTLVVTISQSGETADTLAALRHAKSLGMDKTLTICNSPNSAMVRESKLAYITRAGVEIGVASTKAFTTQLTALFLLSLSLAKVRSFLIADDESRHLKNLKHLPVALLDVLALESELKIWAKEFSTKENALFLGRGINYPIAMEGAIKLKEISYIHAEGYAAGELKHGPIALVTNEMPIIAVAPNDTLLEKLKSNLHEVKARGGVLYVLADADTNLEHTKDISIIRLPEHYGELSPILHVVALQLLAYHTACERGNDVDKPRNLAKSVTVE